MSVIVLKKLPKIIAKICFFVCTCVLIIGTLSANRLPERIYTSTPQDIDLPFPVPMVAKPESYLSADGQQPENGYQATVHLFGIIPIGSTKVRIADQDRVVVGGNPFGIKILSNGVLVVGFNDVETNEGNVNPAKQAGLQEGDLILTVNDQKPVTNNDLMELVEHSKGNPLTIRAKRKDKNFTLTVTPVIATDGHYRVGMWVRDSTAGLGTMTFYHPASGMYGGLGHAVCDSDTGQMMSLYEGEIVGAQVTGLHKATTGSAGELRGALINNLCMGSILRNCKSGVYGKLYTPPQQQQTVEVARKQEVEKGDATVYACVDGTVKPYTCTISRINLKESADHHLVIRITDEDLLQKTGGIVQGMSGSPVVQNGKLVGAITHVFLNQPEKGYGIFAENMLETAQSVADQQTLKEAS